MGCATSALSGSWTEGFVSGKTGLRAREKEIFVGFDLLWSR